MKQPAVVHQASTVKELLTFFWKNRLWWMIPFVVTLVIVGVLIVLAQASPVAPFLYTAF